MWVFLRLLTLTANLLSKSVHPWVPRSVVCLGCLLPKGFPYSSSEYPHSCTSFCSPLDVASTGLFASLCALSVPSLVLCSLQHHIPPVNLFHASASPAPVHLSLRLRISPASPGTASLASLLSSKFTFPLSFQIVTPGHPLGDDSNSTHEREVVYIFSASIHHPTHSTAQGHSIPKHQPLKPAISAPSQSPTCPFQSIL